MVSSAEGPKLIKPWKLKKGKASDLVVPGLIPAGGENLLNRKQGSVARSLLLATPPPPPQKKKKKKKKNRLNKTEYCWKGHKISSHPSIQNWLLVFFISENNKMNTIEAIYRNLFSP